jgi:phosphoserine phosphatase
LATTVTGLYRDGLTGQSTATIASLAEQFVRSDTGLFGFVEPFVRLVREYGLRLVVVSGSPVEPLLAYRRRLSIDRVYGLTVGTAHGRYTPTVVSDPTLGGEKARIVDDLTPGSHIVLALGDSPADLPLLAAAPLSVVVDNPGLDPGASTDVHHISATSLADARRILEGVTVSAALG